MLSNVQLSYKSDRCRDAAMRARSGQGSSYLFWRDIRYMRSDRSLRDPIDLIPTSIQTNRFHREGNRLREVAKIHMSRHTTKVAIMAYVDSAKLEPPILVTANDAETKLKTRS